MNILGYINSVNKISLFVLVAMFLFLLYELYVFQKERARKKISVPSFNPHPQVTPVSPPVQPVQPMPTPVQLQVATPKKTRSKINKKMVGVFAVSLFMISSVGLISFRLSQTSGQNSVAPASPKAASLPTSIPSSPTTIPITQQAAAPTAKPPLLLARSLTSTPTRIPHPTTASSTPTPVLIAKNNPITPTKEPTATIPPKLSATPIPTQTTVNVTPDPSGIQQLPQSGTSQYTIFFIGIASFIILVSFLY